MLIRAEKLQKLAAQHGFDWPNIKPVIEKLEEELAELKLEISKAELQQDDETKNDQFIHERLQDEMGDVLFCCVNLSRFLKVKPEQALRSTNDKFIRRFQFIEKQLYEKGNVFEEATLEQLDDAWERAKKAGY